MRPFILSTSSTSSPPIPNPSISSHELSISSTTNSATPAPAIIVPRKPAAAEEDNTQPPRSRYLTTITFYTAGKSGTAIVVHPTSEETLVVVSGTKTFRLPSNYKGLHRAPAPPPPTSTSTRTKTATATHTAKGQDTTTTVTQGEKTSRTSSTSRGKLSSTSTRPGRTKEEEPTTT
ncbi:MAG: hypothetical protein Q9197_001522, partial [Variospora fuerteventurae]